MEDKIRLLDTNFVKILGCRKLRLETNESFKSSSTQIRRYYDDKKKKNAIFAFR